MDIEPNEQQIASNKASEEEESFDEVAYWDIQAEYGENLSQAKYSDHNSQDDDDQDNQYEERESEFESKEPEEAISEEEEDEEEEEEIYEESELQEEEEEQQFQSQEEIITNPCQICYSRVSSVFTHKDKKHIFDMIQCRKCQTYVHHVCYGTATPVEEVRDEDDEPFKYFTCDYCKAAPHKQERACFICGDKEGCLRLTQNKKWIHTLCGVGIITVAFTDITTMAIDMSAFKRKGAKGGAANKCRICNRRIQTFEATNENNTKHAHLHCALKRGFKNKNWKVFFGLKAEERLKLYRFVDDDSVMDNIETLTVYLQRINKKAGIENSELPKGVKRRKNKGYIKRGRNSRKDPLVREFLQEIFELASSTTKRNFEKHIPKALRGQELAITDMPSTGGRVTLLDMTDVTREEIDFVETRESDGLREIEGLTPFDTVSSIIGELYEVVDL